MNQKVKLLFVGLWAAITLSVVSPVVADDEGAIIEKDDLDVLVITGQRIEKKLKDVAGSKSVVTVDDIDTRVVTDFNELFKYEPGVEVTGRVGGAQNILIRGMGGDRVLMIKDGMRMNEGYGANGTNDIVGRGFIDTDTIKQVEVAKGAASSLYGSDALGGIVVFTTKTASDYLDAGEDIGGQVKLSYSELSNQSSLGASIATVQGKFEHLIHVKGGDGHEQQNFNESTSPFDIESNSMTYKGQYLINEVDFVNFSYDYWQQESAGDAADGLLFYFRSLAPFGYQITDENSHSEKNTDAVKIHYHGQDVGDFADQLNLHVYQNGSRQKDIEYGQLDINAPMFGVVEIRDMWKTGTYEQTTSGFLSNAVKSIDDTHVIGFGIDLETTDSRRSVHEYREVAKTATRDLITQKFPQNDTLRAGIFINDEMTFANGQFIVTPGLRFDHYSMDPNGALKSDDTPFAKIEEDHTSLNMGMLYHINKDTSVFFQYGQGFKVPAYDLAYIEHYLQASSSYIYQVIPADDLEPEESDTYEIGLRSRGERFGFDAAIYHNQFHRFLQVGLVSSESFFNPDGSFSHVHETFQYQNIDSVTIEGAEVAITYYANDGFSAFANASYQHGKDVNSGNYITSISPLKGVLGFSFESDFWTTSININWAQKMSKVNDDEFQSPGYETVDWLMSYDFSSDLSINLAVNNLFDEEYVRHINIAGRSADTELTPFSEPGRTAAMSLRYQF